MSECLVRAKDLTKIYKRGSEKVYAVRDVDLEVNRGDFISLMGPSGSGKTTLLDLIGCLDSISGGKLEVLGRDVTHVKESHLVDMRRGRIGFIFQQFYLIPTLTAIENVELPLYFSGKRVKRELTIDILKKVGLGHRIHHLPKELSGGERQRVAISRALAVSPQLLLADEPTGNLDTKSSQEICNIFERLNREEGLTIVLATHDPALGLRAGRVIYLRDGSLAPKDGSSR
ncbi:ABC transporter ATP-binding protein [Candidatus Omnitrophota bacterium]